jgi:hypothetical protein
MSNLVGLGVLAHNGVDVNVNDVTDVVGVAASV